MDTIALYHKDLGIVLVDRQQHDGNPADGHGWTKTETAARGFKPATPAQIEAAAKKAANADKE